MISLTEERVCVHCGIIFIAWKALEDITCRTCNAMLIIQGLEYDPEVWLSWSRFAPNWVSRMVH